MTEPPLPPSDRPEAPIPWDALEDLASGDLPREAALDLRTRIDAEPALREAYEQAERIEALLRAERPYAAPVGLTERILGHVLHGVPGAAPARLRPLATLVRVAALVLVFFSSWLIVGGETPALASVREAPIVTAALPRMETSAVVPERTEWYRSPVLAAATHAERPAGTESVPGNPAVLALTGIGVLLTGLYLASRWHRSATPRTGGDA